MMHAKIKSVYQLTEQTGVKVIVYGRPGMGKTRLCATAPNPLILSAESGLLSLRKMIRETQVDLPAWEIASLADLAEAYEFVTKSAEAKKTFQTICLDSITEIAEIILKHEKEKTRDGRKAYGELYDHVVGLIRDFRNLPNYHVYFAAQEETNKDGLTGAIYRQASFPGQRLSGASLYQFDEVFQAFKGVDPTNNTEYFALQTQATAQVEAKDRSGMLAPVEYPDLTHLIGKIVSA
jgi:hypothetical protein